MCFKQLFSNYHRMRQVKSLSHVRLLATPWTIAYQSPPFIGFSRQGYWSGLPFPSHRMRQGAFKQQKIVSPRSRGQKSEIKVPVWSRENLFLDHRLLTVSSPAKARGPCGISNVCCVCSVTSNSLKPHGLQTLSMECSRQECWSGCHFLLQGIFATQGLNPQLWFLLQWHADVFTNAPHGKPPVSLILEHYPIHKGSTLRANHHSTAPPPDTIT